MLLSSAANPQAFAEINALPALPSATNPLVHVDYSPDVTTTPMGRTSDHALPQSMTQPTVPMLPDTSKVVGPNSKTPAGPKQEDHVILANLKGLVLIDSTKAFKPGGVKASGVVANNLPMLDDPAIHKQLEDFIGKPLTQASVQNLGQIIVNWYREKKYPFVDVAVPAGQDVTNGVVQVVVTESRLGKINARGNYWFSSKFLESQVRLAQGDRINIENLEEDKNWINQNPFRLVNIVASRSDQPGVTDLTVDTIIEKFPLRAYAGYSNSGTTINSPTSSRPATISGMTGKNSQACPTIRNSLAIHLTTHWLCLGATSFCSMAITSKPNPSSTHFSAKHSEKTARIFHSVLDIPHVCLRPGSLTNMSKSGSSSRAAIIMWSLVPHPFRAKPQPRSINLLPNMTRLCATTMAKPNLVTL
jgi:hypothetical protein